MKNSLPTEALEVPTAIGIPFKKRRPEDQYWTLFGLGYFNGLSREGEIGEVFKEYAKDDKSIGHLTVRYKRIIREGMIGKFCPPGGIVE